MSRRISSVCALSNPPEISEETNRKKAMNIEVIKPQLLALKVVSTRTELSKSTLYRLISAGHLRAVKVGRALRVSESELSRFITALEEGELKI